MSNTRFTFSDLGDAIIHGFRLGWSKAHQHSASCSVPALKSDVEKAKQEIIMKISELKGSLDQVKAQVVKVSQEQQARFDALSAKITELEEQVKDAEVPQGVTDTLGEVKSLMQALDDTIPDTTPEPPVA